ncbi:hypothetical protein KCP74_19805 [Salmonella enterica subsp. enterica]|nr:hypothetical protein KCP74_19805 [Salmonella enterica subsp. enterica]
MTCRMAALTIRRRFHVNAVLLAQAGVVNGQVRLLTRRSQAPRILLRCSAYFRLSGIAITPGCAITTSVKICAAVALPRLRNSFTTG